jgi:ABC-type transport system involved in cytochrome bd biosynthesis fused ATPase/permease subunit
VALVAIEVGTRLLTRSLGFERALFVLLLAPEFFLPIRQFASARHSRLAAHAAGRRLLDLLKDGELLPGNGHAAPPGRIDLEFDAVSYTPPERRVPALAGVSLRLGQGDSLAVVGPSGAGKTTLLSLLLGFIGADSGSILVAGTPLADLDPDLWRHLIAWVPQRPHLFAGTVADNIRLYKTDAPDAAVEAAGLAACAHEFIAELPEGYETPIGERGARLSGGQRQRIALARAFLADRPLVVLDEPTVHLDPELAVRVRAAVAEHWRGRSALVATHDLELAALAARICVLDSGRVREGEPAA